MLAGVLARHWREVVIEQMPADWAIQQVAYAVGQILGIGERLPVMRPFAGDPPHPQSSEKLHDQEELIRIVI